MPIRYLSLYFSTLLSFAYAEFNSTALDSYHEDVCNWLMETSNDIDNYFIESNETLQSKTYAEVRFSSAVETSRASEHALRLRLRLNLPKVQKKLKVFFDDEDSDDLSYDGTSLNNNYKLNEQSYFLRIEYLNYIKKKLSFTAGPGIRFRNSTLHPYLNFKTKYRLEEGEIYESLLFDRFRLYINGDIENIVGFDRFQHLDEQFFTLFHNSLSYKSWEEYKEFFHSFSLIYYVNRDQKFVIGSSITNRLENEELRVDHVQFYVLYRQQIYKDWVYLELNPSLLRREENDYDMSARFMVNVGVRFKKN